MRSVALLFTVFLGGCVHLGAEPIDANCGDLLDGNIETYQSTPLFAELQRDAGFDECPNDQSGRADCSGVKALHLTAPEAISDSDPIVQALQSWSAGTDKSVAPSANGRGGVPVLMLSGGGAWGAFGAGYLDALPRRDWAVVTGVSTGALQALYVAAGDYTELASAYRIQHQDELATSNGLGILSKGSQYNTTPLHQKILGYLLPVEGQSPIIRMLEPGRPALSIAMVEARSGDLKVVHVTRLLKAALGNETDTGSAEVQRAAQCVAGIALASSAIPVRFSPVRIDGHTFVDGGVRSSVFDSGIGRRMEAFASSGTATPHLFALRNGPTIVFRDASDRDHPGVSEVDQRPDILRVGMRGYSTIVNQNELMSIASLRLNYPRGPISVISADGFNAPMNPKPCGPRPEALFAPVFMDCLVDWGRHKARVGPHWIELGEQVSTGLPTLRRASN